MFDRFRKRKDPEGRTCPLCELVNSSEALTCSQCYFQFEKNTRQQDEAISNEEEGTLLDELLNSEVEIDEDDDDESTEHLVRVCVVACRSEVARVW